MGYGKFKWSLRDNLASKVAAAVFLSIVIIEAVILIPSYHNYERDLLLRLEQVGRASIVSAFLAQETPNKRNLSALERAIVREKEVAGGRLYHPNGSIIGEFGFLPDLKPGPEMKTAIKRRSPDGQWLEVVWPPEVTKLPWTVAGRLDARWIKTELIRFVWRIAGLVILISLVVCSATVLILHFLVLGRVRALGNWLFGIDFESENLPQDFPKVNKDDEIGQMASILKDTVEHAARNLSQIRSDRAVLDEDNQKLEEIIEHRTQELRLSKEAATPYPGRYPYICRSSGSSRNRVP